jgi:hypothetical protein
MNRLRLSLLTLLTLATPALAESTAVGTPPVTTAPLAVVRIPSHGCSATVVYTAQDKSYILGCGHGETPRDRVKRHTFDMPNPNPGPRHNGIVTRVVAVDYERDLSLIEINVGPLPYVAPIAPPDWKPGKLVSCGYDIMEAGSAAGNPPIRRTYGSEGTPLPKLNGKDRPLQYPVTIAKVQGMQTLTHEKPWHGRSGGGLIDVDSGYLYGVCSGYGPDQGIYVSLASIHKFLTMNGYEQLLGNGNGGQPQQIIQQTAPNSAVGAVSPRLLYYVQTPQGLVPVYDQYVTPPQYQAPAIPQVQQQYAPPPAVSERRYFQQAPDPNCPT